MEPASIKTLLPFCIRVAAFAAIFSLASLWEMRASSKAVSYTHLVQSAVALLNGEEIEFNTSIESYSITADNIDEFDLDAWDSLEQ